MASSSGVSASPAIISKWRPLPGAVIRVFGDLRFRIDGQLLALAFAPDGTACSVEEPGILRHWAADTGQELSKATLTDVDLLWAFSPDAKRLASGTDDLSLWDVASGRLLATLSQPSFLTALSFRADGRFLAAGYEDGIVRLWEVASGSLRGELEGVEAPISAVAFSLDGKSVAAAGEDKTIGLWNAGNGDFRGRLLGHSDRIQALAWHPGGKLLVSGGWDTTARVWDTTTLETTMLLNGHGDVVSALAFSPDGQLLASADSNNTVWIWDHARCKSKFALQGHAGEITCLAFRRDGQQLLSGGQDRRLILWDVSAGRNLTPTADAHSEVGRLDLSADGRRLAHANGSNVVRVWDVHGGTSLFEAKHASDIYAVASSPDGQWLATGDLRGQIQLWSVPQKRVVRALEMHKHGVTGLAFSADSRTLASAGGTDGYVYLWSLTNFEPVLLVPVATDRCTVETIAFVPGTNLIAAGGMEWLSTRSSEGVICLWDHVERSKVMSFAMGTSRLAARPDGKQLAAATLTDSVCLWELESQTLTAELIGHQASVTGLAYGRDGDLLATGSTDGVVRLWDTESGDCLGHLDLESPICDLALSVDGRWLFTANANTTCTMIDAARLTRR
jgi:WD40 repeat protein